MDKKLYKRESSDVSEKPRQGSYKAQMIGKDTEKMGTMKDKKNKYKRKPQEQSKKIKRRDENYSNSSGVDTVANQHPPEKNQEILNQGVERQQQGNTQQNEPEQMREEKQEESIAQQIEPEQMWEEEQHQGIAQQNASLSQIPFNELESVLVDMLRSAIHREPTQSVQVIHRPEQ